MQSATKLKEEQVDKMSYPEMADAIRAYFTRNGNRVMSSSEVYEDQFADQDKVRFQLVFSNMALKPPHDMIKLQMGGGTKSVKWRLRREDDPPFVEPVKVPRAKRVVEIEKPVAAPAPAFVPSRIQHREIGMVAETPAHIRAQERVETVPVEHRTLGDAPPNNALAAAMARAAKASPSVHKKAPVAQFAHDKVLDYVYGPNTKVLNVPRGTSSLNPKADGSVKLPTFQAEATVKPNVDLKAEVEKIKAITVAAFGPDAKLPEPEQAAVLPTVTVPFGTPDKQSPGQLLDLFLAAMKPMFQSMITDAIKEAFHVHPQVQITGSLQAPSVEIATAGPAAPVDQTPAALAQTIAPAIHAAISVPPLDPPKPVVPKHKPVMPQDADAMVKARLPKVAVIGLPKPQWEFDVKERFAKWLDIKTIHSDAKAKTAGDMSKGADHVLMMIDYVGHSIGGALSVRNIEFENVKGGPSKLDERLREIIKSYANNEANA